MASAAPCGIGQPQIEGGNGGVKRLYELCGGGGGAGGNISHDRIPLGTPNMTIISRTSQVDSRVSLNRPNTFRA